MTVKLTQKRLSALRYIEQHPGCFVGEITIVCDRREVNWKTGENRTWSGFDRAATGSQAATRWGSAYMTPLAKAGLVDMRPATPGGFRLYLTAHGRRTATTGTLAASEEA